MDGLDDEPRDKRRNKLAAERALRAYMGQHFAWLVGYPVGCEGDSLRWRTWPASGGPAVDVLVDREKVRAATLGMLSTKRRFPHALPRLVGDVSAWERWLDARLGVVKRALHDGAALPDAIALAALVGVVPPAVPAWCATAFVWLAAEVVGERTFALVDAATMMRSWRNALENVRAALGEAIAVDLAVVLADAWSEPTLRRALSDASSLRHLLEAQATFEVVTNTGDLTATLAQRMARAGTDESALQIFIVSATTRPTPRFGRDLVAALLQRPRRHVWLALEALIGDVPLASWVAWWRNAERFEREARSELGRLAARGAPLPVQARRAAKLAQVVAAELGKPPAPQSFERVIRGVTDLVDACPEEAREAVIEVLYAVARTDGDTGAVSARRSSIAAAWQEALQGGLSGKRARALAALERRAIGLGADDADAALRAHMFAVFVVAAHVPGGSLAWEHRVLALETLECLMRRGQEGRAFLEQRHRWNLPHRFAGVVGACARALGPRAVRRVPERAADILIASTSIQTWLDPDVLARLAPEEANDVEFWRHAEGLSEMLEGDDRALCDLARAPEQVALLRALAREGATGTIVELARLSAAIIAVGAVVAPLPSLTTLEAKESGSSLEARTSTGDLRWIPSELQVLAHTVRALVGDRGLERALRGDCMSPARLVSEIEALAKLAARDAHQEARLAALRERLAHPLPLTQKRLEACVRRLERRVTGARADAWRRALCERLTECHPAAARAHLDTPRERELITTLARLAPRTRELAFRALAREDFGERPEHCAWRAGMVALGLDLTPWLAGDVRCAVVSPSGRSLTFAIEFSPIEIFQMGAWFDTCLAPGRMSFFSVVANAVDENKRLVVARDSAGNVQARCLLALTDTGRLLTFHVYAHEEPTFVRGVVRELAEGLAKRIGTRLTARGRVPKLVAPAWYDDGPVDLEGVLAPLDEGGELASALRAAPPERARALVVEHFGEERFAADFERIVTHRTIREEPHRLRALTSGTEARALSTWAAVTVADHGRRVDSQLARGILVEALEPRRRRLGLGRGMHTTVAELLVRLDEPSRALHVLRRGRCAGRDSLFARADALKALGRGNEARRTLEGLARSGDEAAARWIEALRR